MRGAISRLTIGSCIVALAGGCAVGPDYKQPQSSVPARWAEPVVEADGAAERDLSRWWTTLNDPTLDRLIDEAVAGNLDLREATARVREARAQRGVVAADGLPQIDAAGSYERFRNSEQAFRSGNSGGPGVGFGDDQAHDYYQAGFDASWEIDIFGRVRRSVESAEAGAQAAVENRRDVMVTLLAEVARTYIELRSFQSRVQIAHENETVQLDTLDITTAKFKAGLTSDLDVARAESQLATTRAAIPPLEAGVRQSVHRLGVLMGREPAALLEELETPLPIPPHSAGVPAGLPSELLRRRPDIRRAERELAAATANIGVATADLYPRFSLTGTFGFASGEFGDLFQSDARFWSVGPAVRWPLFHGGRIRANIDVQNARQEQAAARYEKVVLTALEDVENALVNYARERARLESLRVAVAAEERAVELARQLYGPGLTDFFSVLDTQRQLFALQDQAMTSQGAVASNLVALYKALGGGWESYEPGTAAPADPPAE